MATGARGEETIQAGEREVRVLFTNRALAQAEGKLGKSILKVLKEFSDGESGITELAHLLREGMEAARQDAHAGGRMVTIGDAFKVLEEVGFAGVAGPVMVAVAAVLSYGTSEEPEDEGSDPNV